MRYEYRVAVSDVHDGGCFPPWVTAGRINHDPETILGAGEVCAMVARANYITDAPGSTCVGADYARYTWYVAHDQKIEITCTAMQEEPIGAQR